MQSSVGEKSEWSYNEEEKKRNWANYFPDTFFLFSFLFFVIPVVCIYYSGFLPLFSKQFLFLSLSLARAPSLRKFLKYSALITLKKNKELVNGSTKGKKSVIPWRKRHLSVFLSLISWHISTWACPLSRLCFLLMIALLIEWNLSSRKYRWTLDWEKRMSIRKASEAFLEINNYCWYRWVRLLPEC